MPVESYYQGTVALRIWRRGSRLQEDRCRAIRCRCCLSQAQSKMVSSAWLMQMCFFRKCEMSCLIVVFGVQEMGIIGPNNQLPRRRTGRGRGAFFDKEDDVWTERGHESKTKTDDSLPPDVDASKIFEALSLFPQPKSLLTRVIQVATSSNRLKVCSSHPWGWEMRSTPNPAWILNLFVLFYRTWCSSEQ